MIRHLIHPLTKDVVLIDSRTGRIVPDFPVCIRHLRAAGMCNREPRVWFQRQGLSWSTFATKGLPASVLISTNDPLALKVVEIARKEVVEQMDVAE